jgi:hypothetical protein
MKNRIITVEVDGRLAILLIRLANATWFLWFPWRERVLFWLRRNAIHLCRVRVLGGRWHWA